MNKRSFGKFYEDAVCDYLRSKGIVILKRNFFCRYGEIDIIGKDKDVLVFFEVKYRKDNSYGYAIEAVDYRKQKKIISCARYYLAYSKLDCYIRFDVIGITGEKIDWIKDAFST